MLLVIDTVAEFGWGLMYSFYPPPDLITWVREELGQMPSQLRIDPFPLIHPFECHSASFDLWSPPQPALNLTSSPTVVLQQFLAISHANGMALWMPVLVQLVPPHWSRLKSINNNGWMDCHKIIYRQQSGNSQSIQQLLDLPDPARSCWSRKIMGMLMCHQGLFDKLPPHPQKPLSKNEPNMTSKLTFKCKMG